MIEAEIYDDNHFSGYTDKKEAEEMVQWNLDRAKK